MDGSGSRISKDGSETLTIVKENQIPQVEERERIQFSTTKSCFQQVWKRFGTGLEEVTSNDQIWK